MKKKWPLILCITLTICFSVLCCVSVLIFFKDKNETTTVTETKGNYTPGSISQNMYTSSWLGLKYEPVHGLKLLDSDKLSVMSDSYKNSSNELYKNYYIDFCTNVDDPKAERICLAVFSLQDSRTSEDTIIHYETKGLENAIQSKRSKCKIGDIEFTKISNVKVNSYPYIELIKKIDSYVVLIMVRSDSEEKAEELLSGFSKL